MIELVIAGLWTCIAFLVGRPLGERIPDDRPDRRRIGWTALIAGVAAMAIASFAGDWIGMTIWLAVCGVATAAIAIGAALAHTPWPQPSEGRN